MIQLIYMSKVVSHIIVSGRVQGVGYRRFAQKTAQTLDIRGWTRNLLDGRVEIHAMGSEVKMNEYLDILRQGPAFSQVREVIAINVEINAGTDYTVFLIHPDQEVKR